MSGILLVATLSRSAAADPADRARGSKRLLVVFASESLDPRLAEQRRLYRSARDGSRERDLVLIEAVGQSADARSMRRRFGVTDGEFRAILVGKDGGSKLSSASPIPSETLFEEIDRMPMRRDEMRRRPAAGDRR